MSPSAESGPTLVRSAAAHDRLERAKAWLGSRDSAERLLVVGPNPECINELVRQAVRVRRAAFGWQRITLNRLAAMLALPALTRAALAPVSLLGCEAIGARIVDRLRGEGGLGRYAGVSRTPGFARALVRCFTELRQQDVGPKPLGAHLPELERIYARYIEALEEAKVADRARVLALATQAAADPHNRDPLLSVPTLLLDVAIGSKAERDLLGALVARAPAAFITLASGDRETARHWAEMSDAPPIDLDAETPAHTPLARLQRNLFEALSAGEAPLGPEVQVLSAPGESRECVELARRMHELAGEGVRFDEMAVLLRSAEAYRPHLQETFRRARLPVYFARGTWHPDPSGRAFCALLGCAVSDLSARRFAEYLSLGEVPTPDAEGSPPAPLAPAERWVAPDDELVPAAIADALAEERNGEADEDTLSPDPAASPVLGGTLRAPRRWERLLMEAAVIGGRERWQRRIDGLTRELELDREALEDPDDPASGRIERDIGDLQALRGFALPLLDALAALPRAATWGEWIDALSALATRALRRPERVLAVLAEMSPMAGIGPIDLGEALGVLEERLLRVSRPPSGSRYGQVFVAPIEAARGMSFEVVFVPGLAEKLFPPKVEEEPIALDQVRRALDPALTVNEDRIARERLWLRLAAGAARRRLVLSYPRLDMDQGRPRVPSFYALEALRAAEGKLPGFGELAARAEQAATTHVGWPSPEEPERAIDEAEHDLALLGRLMELAPEESVGTARYLLTANPHLGRALRFRARRWLRGWTVADGLVKPIGPALAAIRDHGLGARSFSPTALQHYATCPYKFLLYAVHKLAPREVPAAIEELDPLQRGSLVHDVQFEFLSRLAAEGVLPVTPESLPAARETLDEVVDGVAKRYREDLAPAIDRVWDDGVAAIRADLREWLRLMIEDESGFVPWRFELSFGLKGRRARDPGSSEEPAKLACGIKLRGSIDLVERSSDNRLRVTDYKTGRQKVKANAIISAGESLQPVLYALAAEQLFADAKVESGRLYYCTSAGGFAERTVALGDRSRHGAQVVVDVIGEALEEPFLPAAPRPRACRWCDYLVVCGPYEEVRVGRKLASRKARAKLAGLEKLRAMP